MATLLDPFASYLIDLLRKLAEEKVGMLLGVRGEIRRMGEKLEDLKSFLADADRKNITDNRVQGWVRELRRIMYEAADILDICQLKAMEEPDQPETDIGCCSPLFFCMKNPLHAHDIGSRINALNGRLDSIKKRSAQFSFIDLGPYEDRSRVQAARLAANRETSGEIDRSGLVGEKIEQDTRKIVQIMLKKAQGESNCARDGVMVFAVVGVGGIGKTTLAQKVFNDEAIQNEFSKKIWLSVNKNFSETGLLRRAITEAGGDHQTAGDTKATLQRTLKDALRGKKLLLVMDDVWDHRAWDNVLKIPFVDAAAEGSRVLVTTRDARVARGMKVVPPFHYIDKLDDDDAWSLLKKQVVSVEADGPEVELLRDIGMQILAKCDGLPLAVKVLGGLLCQKEKQRHDWELVLNDSIWSVSEMPEELNYALYLSYEDLCPCIKQCFLFWSLLPKTALFPGDDIVGMWISEGFVHGNPDDLEELGTKYLEELILRNLIEPDTLFISERICSMHDVVRTFAQYVARDEALAASSGEAGFISKLSAEKILRLSLESKAVESEKLEWSSLQAQKSLRTLISIGLINMKSGDSFADFPCIRTLHMDSVNAESLVETLDKLKHLRYFSVEKSHVTRLPDCIGKMRLLQHISIFGSGPLEKLPDSIVQLGQLRFFRLPCTEVNIGIPRGFCGLTNLRTLWGFPAYMDDDWCSLEELGPLSKLRFLKLNCLENVPATSFASKARLGEKVQLIQLHLRWTSRLGDDGLVDDEECIPEADQQTIEEVFDELQPPPFLEDLNISGYFGQRLPKWMMSSSAIPVNSLKILMMEDLACCIQLPDGLSQLPCLHYIQIKRAPAIKHVGLEFVQPCHNNSHRPSKGSAVGFPRLRRMQSVGMVEWEEWDWEETVQAMPLLEELKLEGCKLRHLPRGLASNAKALKTLSMVEVQHLKSLENFPSLVYLEVQYSSLARIVNLQNLEDLLISMCTNMKVLRDVPALQRFSLEDYTMETLPEYLRDVNPRHMELHCSLALLICIATGQSGSEWDKFCHIDHFKAYAHDGDNEKKWHVLYTRSPFELETNISRDFLSPGTLSSLEDEQRFESIFNMTRRTFSYVCSLVKVPSVDDMNSYTFLDGRVMCLEDRVAIALIMLKSGEPPEIIGSSFNVNQSTISQVTWSFVEDMREQGNYLFRWGTGEIEKIKSKFGKNYGLPNCCGVICSTPIKVCLTSAESNSDHEQNDSVLLQVLLDTDTRFTQVKVGWGGSRNLLNNFHASNLFKMCEKGARLNGIKLKLSDGSQVGEYIIGDKRYPLLPWLLTPYQEEDLPDSPYKEEFNSRHSAARVDAMKALTRFKDTLKFLHVPLPGLEKSPKLADIVIVCCMLHNILIDMEGKAGMLSNHTVENIKQVRQLAEEDGVKAREILSQHLTNRSSESGVHADQEQGVVSSISGDQEKEQKLPSIVSGDQEDNQQGISPIPGDTDEQEAPTNISRVFLSPGTLSLFEDVQRFESVFNMTKRTFSYVCSLVKVPSVKDMDRYTFLNGRVMRLEDRAAVALIMLKSGEPPESVGFSVGVDQSTVLQVTWSFVQAMRERGKHHFRWGTGEIEKIKSKFDKIYGLPNCCGVICSTRIKVWLPTAEDHEQNDGVVLQVLLDTDMRFTQASVRSPGGMNQLSIFYASNLFALCEKGARLNGSRLKLSDGSQVGEYIIGDAGYPLLPWLLTPYLEEDLKDLSYKAEFNIRHSAARIAALKALARFEETLKFLYEPLPDLEKPRKLIDIIMASCILHNILMDMESMEGMLSGHKVENSKQLRQIAEEDAVKVRDILSQHLTSRSSDSLVRDSVDAKQEQGGVLSISRVQGDTDEEAAHTRAAAEIVPATLFGTRERITLAADGAR
ncbi:hypothetical protein ACQ4PT_069252 [Festuca glaucescens]